MKTIRVEEVYRLDGTASASLPGDVPLSEVIARFAHEPGLRAVFLIDAEQRFARVVTRIAIMKWTQFQLFGRWRAEISASATSQVVDSARAKHLARGDWRSLGVKASDTLETAFNQMMNFGEDVIPVLDSEGRILGDLRLSEVLLKAVEVGEQAMP